MDKTTFLKYLSFLNKSFHLVESILSIVFKTSGNLCILSLTANDKEFKTFTRYYS